MKSNTLNIINKISDLPAWTELLTDKSGKLKGFSHFNKKILAIETNEKPPVCAILAIQSVYGSGLSMALRDKCIELGYVVNNIYCITTDVIEAINSKKESENKIEETGGAGRSNIEKDFDELLAVAIDMGVSDIHIEKSKTTAKVRFRVNGELIDYIDLSPAKAYKLIHVAYTVMADTGGKDTSFNEGAIHDGRIERVINENVMSVRFASQPVHPEGFDATLRLLPSNSDNSGVPLKELGYNDAHDEILELMLSRPVGVTILAGVTGSGKSTTIKNMILNLIDYHDNTIKVRTIEDPPEYEIKNARQSPVVRSKKVSGIDPFAAMMKASMRGDPDVIMIGEVRDEATSDLLVKAVESGHKVITTVHASSAIEIISRLNNLGINIVNLTGPNFISGLVYQKLIPVLCDHCKVRVTDLSQLKDDKQAERLKEVASIENDLIFLKNIEGCEHCRKGIKGRSVCAETVILDHKMLDLLSQRQNIKALHYWRNTRNKKGDSVKTPLAQGCTAMDHAITKMRQGLVSLKDVEKEFGYLNMQDMLEEGDL